MRGLHFKREHMRILWTRPRFARRREAVMRNHLIHMAEDVDADLEPEQQGGKRVISFLRHQIENELEWIMTLMREISDL